MRLAFIAVLCFTAVACDRSEPANTAATGTASAEPAAPALPAMTELSSAEAVVAPVINEACNLEYVDGVLVPDGNPIEAKSRVVKVSGWLVDNVTKTLPGQLFVRVYSTSGNGRIWQLPVAQTMERPEVQRIFGGGEAALLKSGFEGQLDMSDLASGKYTLRLSYDRAGELVLCDNGRAVVLK